MGRGEREREKGRVREGETGRDLGKMLEGEKGRENGECLDKLYRKVPEQLETRRRREKKREGG